ncbi:hypothetical protein GN244_ATG10772 [Phytophthora infestans]|uniref:Uncharacterized protein n=1 Tax=Phytophthora infestans TaxID=4787 RepID=A0A833T3S6_PHYIN|nr:hypothetical protein GN244_ATG10772 [Phytophthora infestans]
MRRRVVSVQKHSSWCRTDNKLRLVGVGYLENERILQDARSEESLAAPFHDENRAWSPREDHLDHHNQESNDDDDDSGDNPNNNDDNDEEDSEDDSESSSQSGSSQEAATIQSSIVTNLDGVNIGNTITIINIGANASEPGDGGDEPNGQSSNGLAFNDTDRSAITSAAVRAFCNSIGCNLSNVSETPTDLAPNSIMPPFDRDNVVHGNEAQYEYPGIISSSSVVTMGRAKWLLVVSILVQVC